MSAFHDIKVGRGSGTAVADGLPEDEDLESDVLGLAQAIRQDDALGGQEAASDQEENAKLKRLMAGLSLDNAMSQDVHVKISHA